MEEIDIIELLKRVKEGKAPKEIEINGDKYNYFEDWITLDEIYYTIRIRRQRKSLLLGDGLYDQNKNTR